MEVNRPTRPTTHQQSKFKTQKLRTDTPISRENRRLRTVLSRTYQRNHDCPHHAHAHDREKYKVQGQRENEQCVMDGLARTIIAHGLHMRIHTHAQHRRSQTKPIRVYPCIGIRTSKQTHAWAWAWSRRGDHHTHNLKGASAFQGPLAKATHAHAHTHTQKHTHARSQRVHVKRSPVVTRCQRPLGRCSACAAA